MLKVSVELWPAGRESGRRVIATADIGRVRDGALANYEVQLNEALIGDVGDTALIRDYPRWSASVFDLVVRCLAAALNNGTEEFPPRPVSPEVAVHVRGDGVQYVKLSEIPEPARTFFKENLSGSGIPGHGCAYAHDWYDFLEGQR
ncbi:hypothetical protein [Burkholderia pseudomallei]|uniref:hypothetical protein n=1 Tax=Burkholderia pseudomallei TaxID=28450 RepID=UPI0009774493|nr:hypothetical protein [Burkholderia pseudomallei]MBF3380587.1 hypothetical protein [Burkholderia pseudomallei]MBF3402815.1 hypothetical protein [Burkholderia pseudomallei]CAJ6888513.1 Uncharacterised protein [Burkholderia pseudomallei]CAJ9574016.1 Uncharacterised protein [Burkholderia pseudomallei]VCQ90540.1 Uncharacterised protein [Burkholderia pseudomallei]